MKYDIFISYRRDGGDTLSQLIYDRLIHRGYKVFLDIESLNAGKFNEKLLEVIEECKDIIVVLPPNGLDRCNNEGDWLYRELEHGMKHGKNIVPVLMKNFEWPEVIPEKIAEIKNYNGIIDNKDYFDAVIDKLTTLLISKPAVGGKIFKRIGERGRRIKDRAKKQKRIMFGIGMLMILCIGAVFVLKNMEKQMREKERLNVKIAVTPSEEMSASEYYDAIDILEERVHILADGKKYSFKEENGRIDITIPEEIFFDVEIEEVLTYFVTNPTELYLTGFWGENTKKEDRYFHIDRSAIEKVELVDEAPTAVNFEWIELYGVENEEDCQYYAITVDEEVVKEAKAWLERTNFRDYGVYLDCQEFGKNYAYSLAGFFEKDNILYFLDNHQYSNYLKLALHNYQNETFSKSFQFFVERPVDWEYKDETGTSFSRYGKNQCDVDEFTTSPIVRYDFGTRGDEFTEGEYTDIISAFKKRLDALGTPYAFGTYTTNPYQLAIKLDPDYMNSFILEYIGTYWNVMIRSNYHEVLDDHYIDAIELSENADGTYCINIVPTKSWLSSAKERILNELDKKEEIYLCIADENGIPVDKDTLENSFDGNRFIFDSLSLFGVEELNEENKFFAEFLKAVCETEIPVHFEFQGKYGEADEESVCQIIPEMTIPEEIKIRYENVIEQSGIAEEYSVTAERFGQEVNIEIICPEDKPYSEYVNEIFQKLYNECEMYSGEISTIQIAFFQGSREGRYVKFYLHSHLYEHCMSFDAYYFYDDNVEVMGTFDQIFNEDQFYDQFYISDINIIDGRIVFQDIER